MTDPVQLADDLLPLPEVARLMGVTPHRIWQVANRGDYGRLVRKGRRVYVSRAALRVALERSLAPIERFVADRRRLLDVV